MRKFYWLMSLLLVTFQVNAGGLIKAEIPEAEKVASARYSVFVFDVYDATFYTVHGQPVVEPPYALQLAYLRNIKGEEIADRSAEEMRNQQGIDEITLADWHSQMRNIFPDVIKGDRITGIYKSNLQCAFYKNDVSIGQVKNPQFCDAFFDIWFGKNTSAPKFKAKLLTKQNMSSNADVQGSGY